MKTRNTMALLAAFVLALTEGWVNGQGNIISVSGAIPTSVNQFSGNLYPYGYPFGVSWIASSAFTNVNISIALGSDPNATGIAYLTTRIGPGTTVADEVASAIFAFPSTPSLVPILPALNLQPATYYLIVQGQSAGDNGYGYWGGISSPTISFDPSVTPNGAFAYNDVNAGYPPAVQFHALQPFLLYNVTGFAVPEPSSAVLMLIGGGVLVYVRRRQIKRRSLP